MFALVNASGWPHARARSRMKSLSGIRIPTTDVVGFRSGFKLVVLRRTTVMGPKETRWRARPQVVSRSLTWKEVFENVFRYGRHATPSKKRQLARSLYVACFRDLGVTFRFLLALIRKSPPVSRNFDPLCRIAFELLLCFEPERRLRRLCP